MGAVSSLMQAGLFAGTNIAILAYIGDRAREDLGLRVQVLPRLLVFHFCLCFVLGLVFVESVTVRLDPDYGAVVGPMGTFLAAWLALYAAMALVIATAEYVLLVPMVFAVAHVYGLAKAINHAPSRAGTLFSTAAIMAGLVVLLVRSEYIDEFALQVGDLMGVEDIDDDDDDNGNKAPRRTLPRTYLAGEGGVFAQPPFVVGFATLASFGLMWTQVPTLEPQENNNHVVQAMTLG